MLVARANMTFPEYVPAVMPADDVQGPQQGHWTYKDYADLPNADGRYEVIDGVLFMSPSPGEAHQTIVGEIFAYLREAIKLPGLGKVYLAPFDVELAETFVVQPDILVILKEHSTRITSTRIVGAPDLVVEVLSPGTAGYNRREKQNAYAQAGIPEYWLVEPIGQTVEILLLENEKYRSLGIFHGKATLPSRIVPQLTAQVEQFFL